MGRGGWYDFIGYAYIFRLFPHGKCGMRDGPGVLKPFERWCGEGRRGVVVFEGRADDYLGYVSHVCD